MQNYIELAHRTSAPVNDCQRRLIDDAASNRRLTRLFTLGISIIELAKDVDDFKRNVFGGKEHANIHTGGTLTIEAKTNALRALADPLVVELLHAVVGIVTEAGELMDALQGAIFESKPLDTVNIREEAGDLLWYLAKLLKFSGGTFEEVMEKNIAKLKARHGDKFSDVAADESGRNREAERKILEAPVAPSGKTHTHTLKTDPEQFAKTITGEKTFEIRNIADRDFQVGDTLRLQETASSGEAMKDAGAPLVYTGRVVFRRVTHILRGPMYGLAEGWVIMSVTQY